MTINLDKQTTAKIFNYLRDGKFLSLNSPNKNEKKLYEYVESHHDELLHYFEFIDIDLRVKNRYCYFASVDNKENKLQNIYETIDIISFLYHYNPAFNVGYKFSISDIQEKIKDNITLDVKLKKIKSITGDTLRAKIISLITKLTKRGFIQEEDEYLQQYLVLDSFEYLVEFFNKIEIRE